MELLAFLVKIIVTFLLLGFMGLLTHLFEAVVLKPKKLQSKLQKQGIQGPPSSFLIGNMWEIMKTTSKDSKLTQQGEQVITHNCASVVFPHLDQWRKKYGMPFLQPGIHF